VLLRILAKFCEKRTKKQFVENIENEVMKSLKSYLELIIFYIL